MRESWMRRSKKNSCSPYDPVIDKVVFEFVSNPARAADSSWRPGLEKSKRFVVSSKSAKQFGEKAGSQSWTGGK
jgi:hypothetical protein